MLRACVRASGQEVNVKISTNHWSLSWPSGFRLVSSLRAIMRQSRLRSQRGAHGLGLQEWLVPHPRLQKCARTPLTRKHEVGLIELVRAVEEHT